MEIVDELGSTHFLSVFAQECRHRFPMNGHAATTPQSNCQSIIEFAQRYSYMRERCDHADQMIDFIIICKFNFCNSALVENRSNIFYSIFCDNLINWREKRDNNCYIFLQIFELADNRVVNEIFRLYFVIFEIIIHNITYRIPIDIQKLAEFVELFDECVFCSTLWEGSHFFCMPQLALNSEPCGPCCPERRDDRENTCDERLIIVEPRLPDTRSRWRQAGANHESNGADPNVRRKNCHHQFCSLAPLLFFAFSHRSESRALEGRLRRACAAFAFNRRMTIGELHPRGSARAAG